MIKINLLKNFSGGTSEDLIYIEEQENAQANAGKRLLLMAVGPIALYAYEFQNLPNLQERLQGLQSELESVQSFNQKKGPLSAEIEKWKKDQERLDKQIQFLRLIEEERHLTRDVLLKLQEIIPDQVWISSISIQDMSLKLSGEGVDQADILEFNKRLENLAFLREVTIPAVNPITSTSSGITTYGFDLSAEILNVKGGRP